MALRARDIGDMCYDLGIERPSVTVKEGWDHSSLFILAFGMPSNRQTMQIDPAWSDDHLKDELQKVMQPCLPSMPPEKPLLPPISPMAETKAKPGRPRTRTAEPGPKASQ